MTKDSFKMETLPLWSIKSLNETKKCIQRASVNLHTQFLNIIIIGFENQNKMVFKGSIQQSHDVRAETYKLYKYSLKGLYKE